MDEKAAAALKKARAKLEARDPAGAIAELKPAISNGSRSGELMELVGVAHGMAGNASAARAAFEEATRLDPGRVSAHYNYAVILSRDGELEMAVEEANTALYIDPKHAGAAQLKQQVTQQIQDRKRLGEEVFRTVGREASMDARTSGAVSQLKCLVCGKTNLFTARVCRHCGTFIKEMPDIVPVE
jgi:tetratricopeptide (TPR) repeat protein